MTRYRVSIGVSLLVAGVVVPRVGRAQDTNQILQQQIQQQMQDQAQQAQQAQQQAQQAQQSMDQQMQMQTAASYQTAVVIPQNLQVGNQHFDASVTGFRAYIETIKSSDPSLYGQLAPDVVHLESRQDAAKAALAGGIVVGLASMVYGFAGGDNCKDPSITDPNFAADVDAWGACNDRNMSKMATFGFLGLGAIIVGSIVAYASWPNHQDLLDLVNKNNRVSKQPAAVAGRLRPDAPLRLQRRDCLVLRRLVRIPYARGNLPRAPRDRGRFRDRDILPRAWMTPAPPMPPSSPPCAAVTAPRSARS